MPDPVRGERGEDATLLTLARGAASRTGGAGAAVRDDIGRTYVAGEVALRSLTLTPVQAAVAAAFSSGARRLEAVAIAGHAATAADRAVLAELGDPVVVMS
jgi:hypothetical protein